MAKDFFKKGPHAAKNKVKVVDAEVVSDADERKTVILDEELDAVEFDAAYFGLLGCEGDQNLVLFGSYGILHTLSCEVLVGK